MKTGSRSHCADADAARRAVQLARPMIEAASRDRSVVGSDFVDVVVLAEQEPHRLRASDTLVEPGADAKLTQPQTAPLLRGRSFIVTGGSRGLGACIAQVLGEGGARVVLADIVPERAQNCAALLGERGIDALALPLDVGDEEQVQRCVAQARERFGRLDGVVNNAAIDITLPIAELSAVDWERVVRTNLTGPFLMAKHAAAAMARNDGGAKGCHIVNIASTASKRAWPNAAAYR